MGTVLTDRRLGRSTRLLPGELNWVEIGTATGRNLRHNWTFTDASRAHHYPLKRIGKRPGANPHSRISRGKHVLLALLVFSLSTWPFGQPVQAQAMPEIRALWVDAFHDGIKTPAQVDRMIADARRGGVNTLLVQVRRRGDVYLGSPEPLASDLAPNFDSLRYLLDLAHSGSPWLEVQAWIPVLPIWSRRSAPPSDPNHPLNRHGPGMFGDDNWMMLRDDGELWAGDGYWFDPGHPAVVSYLASLSADLARRYDIDGLHLDRLRYYQGDSGERWIRGSALGIQPCERTTIQPAVWSNRAAGAAGPLWLQFRRDQVTELLRQIRSGQAARPGLKISAAVIPWGAGPRSDSDWLNASAYSYVFQDWRSWMEQGLLEQAYAMNYFRETSSAQSAWLDQWMAWQRTHAYGRQMISGLGVYLNQPTDTIRQVRRALAPVPGIPNGWRRAVLVRGAGRDPRQQ